MYHKHGRTLRASLRRVAEEGRTEESSWDKKKDRICELIYIVEGRIKNKFEDLNATCPIDIEGLNELIKRKISPISLNYEILKNAKSKSHKNFVSGKWNEDNLKSLSEGSSTEYRLM